MANLVNDYTDNLEECTICKGLCVPGEIVYKDRWLGLSSLFHYENNLRCVDCFKEHGAIDSHRITKH